MKSAVAVVLVVALLVVSVAGAVGTGVGVQSVEAAGDWSMLGRDPAGTGYNPSAAGPESDVGARWVVHTDGPASDIQPAVADGRVYVGSGKYSGGGRGVLFAVDAATGAVGWRTDLGDSVHTTAAVGDGRVFVVVRDEANEREFVDDTFALVAVDAATGSEVWRTPLPGEDAEWVLVESGLVLADDTLYLSMFEARGDRETSGGAVLAFDAVDGQRLWRHATAGGSYSVPAVANGTVYVTTISTDGEGEGHALALDATDGSVRWDAATGMEFFGVTPLSAGDRVYVTGPQLLALAAADGSVVRTYDVRVYSNTRPALADGTLYYAADTGETLAALDTASGDVTWERRVAGYEADASPSVGARHVYVGTVGGTVEAFDRETGVPVWNVTLDDRFGVDSTPVPVGDTVYVGPAPFHLYALAEGGTATPGGVVGGFVDWLAANPPLNGLFVGAVAVLLVGGLGGLGLYGLIRGLHYSDAPPRLLAAHLFGREYAAVSRRQVLAAHLVASVGLLLAFVVGGVVLTALGAALAVGGLPGFSLLAPVGPFLLVLVVLGGWWAVLAYRWLPRYEHLLDADLETVRRQWAVVHAAFAVVAGLLPVVFFLLFLVVFQPF